MSNIIKDKTYKFSLKILEIYKDLYYKHKEFIISKQLLKCGTSIGANIEEALGAQSRKDFTSKMFVSYKEARETRYWLRLLRDSKFISISLERELIDEIEEICKILGKILKTSRRNN